jgi:diguanylate cyclase (GGDEF)-like protein
VSASPEDATVDRSVEQVIQIWAGTTTALYRVDAATGAVERSAISTSKPGAIPAPITSLMTDHAGRLWISTDGAGLYQLQSRDAKGQMSFREVLDTDAGQLLEAADGSLWFPADHTVERLNPATLTQEAFSAADGLPIDNFWLNGGSVTPDGKLLLAGTGGLVVIDPRATPQVAQPVTVNVTDFIVGEKPNASAQSIANAGKGVIEVRPNANTFSVEFAALDYAAPAMSEYAYRMQGVDRDWVMTDADHRIARYTNLSPGRYTLEIKATNRRGAWGPARSIAIRVYPAWYQTAWAKLIALAAGFALIFWLVRLYTAILRARQRQLERQVTLRTAELRATTVELQRSQQELERIAYSDSLTGLSNRRMFADCFKKLMAQKQEERGSFTLLQIDLDRFKSINDGYGHDVGDLLLCEVAQRLVRSVEDAYCLARIGGDEFAILLDKVTGSDKIDRVCAAIKQALAEPLLIQGFEFRNTASIGVAVYPQDGSDQESLFKAADVALYDVKREGRDGWRRHRRDQAAPAENAASK